tara:strand:+ start:12634 stop:13131 length:498 start_codon:yes stop_codon:yes gene_type:complete
MKKILILIAVFALMFSTGYAATNIYNDGYNVIDSAGVWDFYAYEAPSQTITTNDTLTAAESGKVSSVTWPWGFASAGSITMTLPAATTVGLTYTITAASSGTIYVDANSGSDTIAYFETTTLDAGDKLASPGSTGDSVTVMCPVANKWVITGMQGTWTDGGTDGE